MLLTPNIGAKFFFAKYPTLTRRDHPMLRTLFGEEALVTRYKEQKSPGGKIEMIWKTPFFQVDKMFLEHAIDKSSVLKFITNISITYIRPMLML